MAILDILHAFFDAFGQFSEDVFHRTSKGLEFFNLSGFRWYKIVVRVKTVPFLLVKQGYEANLRLGQSAIGTFYITMRINTINGPNESSVYASICDSFNFTFIFLLWYILQIVHCLMN